MKKVLKPRGQGKAKGQFMIQKNFGRALNSECLSVRSVIIKLPEATWDVLITFPEQMEKTHTQTPARTHAHTHARKTTDTGIAKNKHWSLSEAKPRQTGIQAVAP